MSTTRRCLEPERCATTPTNKQRVRCSCADRLSTSTSSRGPSQANLFLVVLSSTLFTCHEMAGVRLHKALARRQLPLVSDKRSLIYLQRCDVLGTSWLAAGHGQCSLDRCHSRVLISFTCHYFITRQARTGPLLRADAFLFCAARVSKNNHHYKQCGSRSMRAVNRNYDFIFFHSLRFREAKRLYFS